MCWRERSRAVSTRRARCASRARCQAGRTNSATNECAEALCGMPSTVVKSIDYEAALSRLTVTFTTGRIYDYFAVPADVAEAFRSAFSKGTFFNTRIRDKYPCKER